ncbi:MAG: hypothetical protein AAFS10_14505, partial [Myxococcota bacterium]
MNLNERLASLRHILHSEPNLEAWGRVCELVDQWQSEQDARLAASYLVSHFERWLPLLDTHTLGMELFTSPGARENLRRSGYLNLESLALGPQAIKIITRLSAMERLRSLNLSHNTIGPEGASAIGRSTYMKNLHRLNLTGNAIGPGGVEA